MSRQNPMRIGLRLQAVGTLDHRTPGNVMGDELVACCWQKYLQAREDVASIDIYGPTGPTRDDLDVLIHFNPNLELHARAKNIWYLQNAYPKETFNGGTLGVFGEKRSRFVGFMFTSDKLMRECAPGAVVPFAAEPELLKPEFSSQYACAVSFVGNDIRGQAVNDRYFVPAVPFGLVIYGNNFWQPPLHQVCRGKLPIGDMAKLYSSTSVNLNAHVPIHIEFDTVNLRIFEALACEGFLLSDHVPAVEAEFGEAVAFTSGYEDLWAKLVRYLADEPERRRRAAIGRKMVLDKHTYAHRASAVMDYLHQVV